MYFYPFLFNLLFNSISFQGFAEGYVYWDDEDLPNHNNKGGTLPDGDYDKNTRIYYCCRLVFICRDLLLIFKRTHIVSS